MFVAGSGGGGAHTGHYSHTPPWPEPPDRAAIEAYIKEANVTAWDQLTIPGIPDKQERHAQMSTEKRLPNGVTATQMIRLRMHIPERDALPFPHMHAVQNENDVVVFVITKSGEPIVLRDALVMFPSDALISKLNLLRA